MQSFLIVLMEITCFFLFQDTFVPTEKKYKSGIYVIWIFAVAGSTFAISYVFENSFILKEIAMIVLLFSSIVVLNRKEKKRALLTAVMFIFLLVIADVITILLDTKIFVVENTDIPLVDMLVILTSKSILIILVLCLRKYVIKRQNRALKQTDVLRYTIIPFISICFMALILSSDLGEINAKMRYVIWGCLTILLLVNLLLVIFMRSDAEKKQILYERKMMELALLTEKKEYEIMEEKWNLQKSLNHDYRNHLNCLQGLMKHKEYDEVEAYLANLNRKYSVGIEYIDTGNVIINTVLNEKYNEAKELGAAITLQIGDLSKVLMEEIDIILLLSNLLNNAIEALRECKKNKVLRIKLELEREEFLIAIQNSFEGERKKNGDFYDTTKKKDAELHGYGLKNIQNTVEKYGGFSQFDVMGEEFHTIVIIPIKGKIV